MRQPPATIARHAALLDPVPARRAARVAVSPTTGAIDVVARDRPGLLAAVTSALAASGSSVVDAVVATWPDGAALESFTVAGSVPSEGELVAAVEAALAEPQASSPCPDATLAFDRAASPWHTVCEVRAPERPGLLHDIAAAFAAAEVLVLAAAVRSEDGVVLDRFELTDRAGAKLGPDDEEAVARHLRDGVRPRRRRFSRR